MDYGDLIEATYDALDIAKGEDDATLDEARIGRVVNAAYKAFLIEIVRETGDLSVARNVIEVTWTAGSESIALATLHADLTKAWALEFIQPLKPETNGVYIALVEGNQVNLRTWFAGRQDVRYGVVREDDTLYIYPKPPNDIKINIAYIPEVKALALAADEPVLNEDCHGIIPIRAAMMIKKVKGMDATGLISEYNLQKAALIGLIARKKNSDPRVWINGEA